MMLPSSRYPSVVSLLGGLLCGVFLAVGAASCSSSSSSAPPPADVEDTGAGGSSGKGNAGNSSSGTGGSAAGSNAAGGNAQAGKAGNSAGGNSAGGATGGSNAGGATGGSNAGGATGGSNAGGATGGSNAGGAAGGSGPGGNGAGGDGTAGVSGNGQGGDGGAAGAPPDPKPVCIQNTPWALASQGASVLIESSADDHLGSITPDGLTIAWTTGVDNTVFYADRPDLDTPFGAYSQLPQAIAASGYPALDRAALSESSKTLVLVSTDRKRLGQLTRIGRGNPFDTTLDETPFAALNQLVASDQSIGDPVLAPGDRTLYYSRYSASSNGPTIFVAKRNIVGDPWTPIGPIDDPALNAVNGQRRQLSGVSSDELTFFYFDQSAGISRGSWRKNLTKPFDYTLDLLNWVGVQPIGTCFDLYFSSKGMNGKLDLFRLKPALSGMSGPVGGRAGCGDSGWVTNPPPHTWGGGRDTLRARP